MNTEKWVGKTIERIETNETNDYVVIHFTDGSSIEFSSTGSEFSWLKIYEND